MKNINLVFALLLMMNSASAQTWEKLNDVPFYNDHSNGFGFHDKAYIIQGEPEGGKNKLWEYTPDTDTWEEIGDFPGNPRVIAIGDDWNDKYYFGFGSAANDLWEFDPVDTSFTQLPSCPCIGRAHPALIAFNDKVFMGSGSGANGDLDDWWEYDMTTQIWTQKQDIPGGNRHHPFFFESGNSVFVGGGHRLNWIEYNMDTEEWTAIDDAPQGRVAGTQLSYKGLGLIVGGDDVSHQHVPDVETFMSYDPQIQEWQYLPSLPDGSKWAPSSFIVEDVLYFFGGVNGNIENDRSLWKFDLTYLDCLPAQNLNALNITDTNAALSWSATSNTITDTLKWRKVGEPLWNIIPNPQAVFALENLEACQDYEYQLVTECETLTSDTDILTFKTDGCCINPPIAIDNITTNTADLQWDNIWGAQTYDIRWRPVDETVWSIATLSNNDFDMSDLLDCTEYEFQIKSVCTIAEIEYSESIFFYTAGCGSCLDIESCSLPASLDGSFDYIDEVKINNYVNNSGSNGGYANFAVPESESVMIGETFELSVKTVNDFFDLNLKVWIDFNANGVFSGNEIVVQEQETNSIVTKNILIPNNTEPGLVRMRILYEFEATNPCQGSQFDIGEAEDYCLNLTTVTNIETYEQKQNNFSVYPNPFRNSFKVASDFATNKKYQLSIVNVIGKTIQTINDFDLINEVDLTSFPSGIYFLKIEHESNLFETIKLVKE